MDYGENKIDEAVLALLYLTHMKVIAPGKAMTGMLSTDYTKRE